MAAAQPARALDEFAPRPLGGRALVPVEMAAPRARSGLGAPAACASGAQSAPLAARHRGVGSPAGQGHRRHAAPALGAPRGLTRAAPPRGRRTLTKEVNVAPAKAGPQV